MGAKRTGKKPARFEHWKKIAIVIGIYDVVAVSVSYFLALLLRFDFRYSMIEVKYLEAWQRFALIYAAACLIVFALCGLYKSIWRFAGFNEFVRTLVVSLFMSAIHVAATLLFYCRMPISYYMIGAVLQCIFLLAIRFSYKAALFFFNSGGKKNKDRIMLIGAGAAGQMILRDINTGKSSGRVVCIIDDNSNKWNRYIDGILVAGGRESILDCVEKYRVNKIFIALPSATMAQRRDILSICNETDCEIKNLPGMYQFFSGQLTASALKEVSIEDLLGRDPIKPDLEEVFAFINGKTVMVTGGGGSIGSELCRQIAGHSPKRLIIFDIYENNAYDIQLELKEKHPDLDLVVLIGSVRDSRRMDQVFADYRPEIVYHAAAHKHVPLMEDSPCEAIKNNAIGTYKTAYAAMMHGCERFVLISTDKAVNPTNIMGASKRLCEMVIQSFDAKIKAGRADEIPALYLHKGSDGGFASQEKPSANCHTEFVAVRFGNVLGSNGSVVPVFKRQIARGGPVTVTHPDIIRYFMTVPEAVSLVMLAGTYAHGGEIFVLDMGSPVKIDTLARNLIRLSGLKPDEDIKIEYTGLRPGEKLYEEKLMAEEGLKTTDNKLIHIGCPIAFDTDRFLTDLGELIDVSYRNDPDIRLYVERMVPTYHPTYNGQRILPDPVVKEEEKSEETSAAQPLPVG
ncbi:MAG: polysaccharide biosynthesis protein [Oscillospiraceae bacterium]|nr:polysaccharide biosynthesis protein [Oscillospiraceae bacterium]